MTVSKEWMNIVISDMVISLVYFLTLVFIYSTVTHKSLYHPPTVQAPLKDHAPSPHPQPATRCP